jgi:hypothetical protein
VWTDSSGGIFATTNSATWLELIVDVVSDGVDEFICHIVGGGGGGVNETLALNLTRKLIV